MSSNVVKSRSNVVKSRSNVVKSHPNVVKSRSNAVKSHPNVVKSRSNAVKSHPNVVKSRNSTVPAVVLGKANIDKIPAADLHLARKEVDAAQAKIDQLTRELEIEQVRRRQAEAMCRDATVKLSSQSQTLHSLKEENIELQSTLTNVTAERDELMGVMKELAFARAILANDLSANDSVSDDTEESVDLGAQNIVSSLREENIELHSTLTNVTAERDELMRVMKELAFARTILANDLLADDSVSDDTEERVDIVAKCTTRLEKRPEVRFAEFVDVLVYQQEEVWEEEVTSSCEFFEDDSDDDKSTDSNMSLCSDDDYDDDKSTDSDMSLCSDLDTIFDSAFPSLLSMDFSSTDRGVTFLL